VAMVDVGDLVGGDWRLLLNAVVHIDSLIK
jgi:hypothetical protein